MTKTDVSQQVKAFYNETPFPDYDDIDTAGTLIDKASRSMFARLLDEQLPLDARILECGCGTGQLSNFLSIRQRQVVAADLSIKALQMGKTFAEHNDLHTVSFVNMNLFAPPFPANHFDLVIANGVLHHTANTQQAFLALGNLVRPGGYIVIGLYHRWGRVMTDIRRVIFRLTGSRFHFLDPHLRGQHSDKQRAWFNDQYQHPCERKHTIRETAHWFSAAGFDVVRSIPDTHLFKPFAPGEPLFRPSPLASRAETAIREFLLMFNEGRDGGFFILIGRKR